MTIHVLDSMEIRELPFEQGQTILNVLQNHDIAGIHAPCGGKGICQKCLVTVHHGLETYSCMACTTPAEDGMRVELNFKKRISFAQSSSCRVYTPDPGQTGYAVALDVGTTTLVCHLMNLQTGECEGTVYGSNAQSAFGANVLSRMQAAAEGNFETLRELLVNQLNQLIDQLLESAHVPPEALTHMTVVGNTIMMHFAAGINPAAHGIAPFVPDTLFGITMDAAALGYHVHGDVYFPPAVTGFLGSDSVACVLSANLREEPEPVLLIDLGTNSEMILGCGDRYVACAADAGSAFKGSFYDYGIPASKGAISGVSYQNGAFKLNILGKTLPMGICGSGMIDAIAIMVRLGIVDEMGHIVDPEELPPEIAKHVVTLNGQRAVRLTKFGKIFVTQADVTRFQLSKAALYSGVQILAEEYGIPVEKIAKCQLAGSFGTFINPESAAILGLIPPEELDRTELLGNAAASGSQSAALSAKAREELLALRNQIRYISLSEHPDFNDNYIDGMLFGEEE